jgi:hypothetical protein
MNRFFINMVKYFIPNELTLEEEPPIEKQD